MAPNKFEKHIKKQLEERELQPSDGAWDSLSEKLDADLPALKKKGYLWYGMAASFIGLLLISTVYFNIGNGGIEPEIKVVNSPEKEIEKSLKQNGVEEKVKEKSADSGQLKEAIEKLVDREESTQIKKNDSIEIAVHSPTVLIDSAESITQSQNDTDGKFENKFKRTEQLIDTKVSELLATVNHFKNGEQDITDSEVDSLLRQAEMELMAENLFQDPSAISATALLTEVEDELDPTFRDRIFESLKNKLLKARTAVVNRNN